MHIFIEAIIRSGHKAYDYNNPPNYHIRRMNEDKRFKKNPKDLTITQIDEEEIKGEYISKETNIKDKIILYIHGGGFVSGYAKSRLDFTFYMAKKPQC